MTSATPKLAVPIIVPMSPNTPDPTRRPLTLVVAGVVFFVFCVLIFGPPLLTRSLAITPQARLTLESDIRYGFAQVGLCVVFGVLALQLGRYLQSLGTVVENATQTLAAAQQTAHFTAQAQETERYGRAMALLGAPQIEVRLGGIYALERLARESQNDHGPIMEVLAAYVREHGAWHEGEPTQPRPAADLQAILTVLGRRHAAFDPAQTNIDLHATGLARAYLPWAHLERAFLYEANLDGAILQNANLRGAWLWKSSLQETVLDGAHLEGADLTAVSGLTAEQLKTAHMSAETKLPQYLRAEFDFSLPNGVPKTKTPPKPTTPEALDEEAAANAKLPTLRTAS